MTEPDCTTADCTEQHAASPRLRRLRPGWWLVAGSLLLALVLRGGLWPTSGSASSVPSSMPDVSTTPDSDGSPPLRSTVPGSTNSPSAQPATAGEATTSTEPPTDDQYRAAIVGRWEQENHGRRTLDVRADGTALMVVQPESAWQFLFGKRLEFDVRWQIESGTLITTVVEARPGATARAARRMYGDRHVSPIIELTDTLLRLNDEQGEEHTPWHRQPSTPASAN